METCRRIASSFCRYSAFKEVGHKSPLLQCRLCMVTSFQKYSRKGVGKITLTLQQRNLANTTSTRWSRSTATAISHVDSMIGYLDVMWWEWHFTSVVFLPKAYSPNLIMRKIVGKSQLRDILQNTWTVLFKTVKIVKNKGILRNFHGLEEPKETWELNVMWYPRWDPK